MYTTTFFTAENIKPTLCATAGIFAGLFAPMIPYALLCTLFVLADSYTAWQLGRRLRRKFPNQSHADTGKLSSRKFGHTVISLIKIYAAITLASLAQKVLFEDIETSFNCTRLTAGAICFWQLLSILENESTCSDARWAAIARRFLIDKTSRHIHISPDINKPSEPF